MEKCYLYGSCKCQTAGCVILPDDGCPVYRYFRNLIIKDYENRLKANIIAILTSLQLDIEEKGMELCDSGWYLTYSDIVQQKIDKLKEESEE